VWDFFFGGGLVSLRKGKEALERRALSFYIYILVFLFFNFSNLWFGGIAGVGKGGCLFY
jgi:hypothetical protein